MNNFIEISNDNKELHRHNFTNWMSLSHPDIKHPNIIFSNIMLSIKNDIGFSINDLLNNKITLNEYESNYVEYFTKISRKSPKGHASVHKWNARFFIDYIKNIDKI